ncbi:hypothetical protein ACIQUF_12615 [Pseudomonas sp. NPDC090233]|uniref:hypothetical protein n=1 Tax=Pseudomonas sp. NPDC090233 TaxID=3364479 RepID=UPI00383B4C35
MPTYQDSFENLLVGDLNTRELTREGFVLKLPEDVRLRVEPSSKDGKKITGDGGLHFPSSATFSFYAKTDRAQKLKKFSILINTRSPDGTKPQFKAFAVDGTVESHEFALGDYALDYTTGKDIEHIDFIVPVSADQGVDFSITDITTVYVD